MSTASEFFRHCPSCGRRFQIRLEDRKIVGERKEVERVKKGVAASTFYVAAPARCLFELSSISETLSIHLA